MPINLCAKIATILTQHSDYSSMAPQRGAQTPESIDPVEDAKLNKTNDQWSTLMTSGIY